jgi:hypothetical protein
MIGGFLHPGKVRNITLREVDTLIGCCLKPMANMYFVLFGYSTSNYRLLHKYFLTVPFHQTPLHKLLYYLEISKLLNVRRSQRSF